MGKKIEKIREKIEQLKKGFKNIEKRRNKSMEEKEMKDEEGAS